MVWLNSATVTEAQSLGERLCREAKRKLFVAIVYNLNTTESSRTTVVEVFSFGKLFRTNNMREEGAHFIQRAPEAREGRRGVVGLSHQKRYEHILYAAVNFDILFTLRGALTLAGRR